ncbi:4-amino-4-deoxy-L-arabinose transferase [Nocardioides sp.]|uniref:uridine kinase family protein n=1 Tax=Nocardioides sp. TaxID=35761 RepID=UPI001A1E95BD|nr:4-amino-4-deoxy-L-arabinose transferase [Nocardioides sp.]MBJ7359805.1 4-amino-4-deoxy-L-arabinose transferase [Nocardioides sp.]
MATGSPPDVAAAVLELASSRPATCGGTRVVCVDGPAGSGKTTLASALAGRTGAQVVHMDDLMEGWDGLAGTGPQLSSVLEPLAAGEPGSYRQFNWHLGRFDRLVDVPVADWLVIEGVGSGNPAVAGLVTALVWVEADDELRLARGMERDGPDMEPQWRQFMLDERNLFHSHRTRDRADVHVDGTGARPPVLRP